jgi:L-histidine Nalpha-methyltransferase
MEKTALSNLESDLAAAVHAGLSAPRKTLPCRFFYDREGSELFEEICALPEYYLTRTEDRILREQAAAVAAAAGGCAEIVELGSGTAVKTRTLLSAFLRRRAELRYVPVDISGEMLERTAEALREEFPSLQVLPLAAEYGEALDRLGGGRERARLFLFLGSNLGNFETGEAVRFLRRVRAVLGAEDRLLMGLDLRKDPALLHAAYNDSRGVTARFNLNLLRRINRELGADFDLEAWEHHAPYDADRGRVEMHLVSRREQTVRIGRREYRFRNGETIHTENSCKYSPEGIRDLGRAADLRLDRSWQDGDRLFSVNLFSPGSTK